MADEVRDQTKLALLIAAAYRLGKYDEAVKLEQELVSLQTFVL